MIDKKKTALLVLDMQNDFTEADAVVEVPNIKERFPELKRFIDHCRQEGIVIIYTRHNYHPAQNPVEARLFPQLEKDGLRKGSRGFDINSHIAPEKTDIVLDKTRYDAFYKTELEQILESQGVTNVIIIGTMTDICCESTARSAMYRNYHVWFVDDLNFTADENKHQNTLATIKSHFGTVISSRDLLNQIK